MHRRMVDRGEVTVVFTKWLKVRSVIFLIVVGSCLLTTVFAAQNQTTETEVWDVEFTGKGDPRDFGFKGNVINGATFNFYDRFTNSNVMPSWMTANGNPGGYFYRDSEKQNTKATGWTAEWRLVIENKGRGLALSFNDDTSLIHVLYDEVADTVTLQDGLIGLEGNNQSVNVSLELGKIGHVYRLIRRPGSPAVELYIDHRPVAAARITPWSAADHGEASQLKRVLFASSSLNAAWDFFRYHRGATLPSSKTVQNTQSRPVVGHSPPVGNGYQTYVASPAINNSVVLEGQPLPMVWRDEQVMKVLCARDEYEPATFLILTSQPLEEVMVRVSDLSGPGGVLKRSAVDVRVAQKIYRPVTWGCVTFPWLLVHDPEMLEIIEGPPKWIAEYDPDSWNPAGSVRLEDYIAGHSKTNRLNKELVDTDTLQAADIEDYRQFWLTVHVPADAKSGTYQGDVTITTANAPATTLALEVKVPSFDLLPPPFQYSIYYPTQLEGPKTTDAQRERYNPLTEQQYLAECHNMATHGCTNPCIYGGPQQDEQGNIDFSLLNRLIDLREKGGMPQGVMLYLMDGAGMSIKRGELTEQERQRNIDVARATVAWAKSRGYLGALFMGADEFYGDALRDMRESYAAIRDGGSGIWVAGGRDLVDFMSDVVSVPVFAHPGAMAVDQNVQWGVESVEWLLHPEKTPNWDPEILLTPGYQQMIKNTHKEGNKFFTYFDPQGGQPFPEYHRRHRGMGLWKTGVDGTMTWAYIHFMTKTVRLEDPQVKNNGVNVDSNSFVMRGPQGPLDTLSWEGYREGYDDARYLATLQDALARAKAAGRHPQLVSQTQRWLDNTTVDADLDSWRWEMATRTEALLHSNAGQ